MLFVGRHGAGPVECDSYGIPAGTLAAMSAAKEADEVGRSGADDRDWSAKRMFPSTFHFCVVEAKERGEPRADGPRLGRPPPPLGQPERQRSVSPR